MRIVRFLRGALGIAAFLGLAGTSLIFPSLWSVYASLWPRYSMAEVLRLYLHNYPTIIAVAFGQGALCGFAFALLLAIASRRVRSVTELSMRRMALFGVVAGVGIPWVIGGPMGVFGFSIAALLGIGTSTGVLAIARRADAPKLPAPNPTSISFGVR